MVKYFGVCPECNKPNTGYAWCNKCDPGKFLKGKTSGNPEIDNLIYELQLQLRQNIIILIQKYLAIDFKI